MAGYSSRCAICTHRHADAINDMIRRRALGEAGMTFLKIIEVVDGLGGPTVSECGLSRHTAKHFDVHAEGRRRAVGQYEDASAEVAEKVRDDLSALDAIRDMGMELIESGELKPDVKDVIAAIKVKRGTVMKDENPMEVLLDLVAGLKSEEDD